MAWDLNTNIKGPKGDKGDQGPQGIQGPPGQSGTGSGNVNGPASSVDSDIALFNGASGTVIKDSGVQLSALAPKANPVFTGDPQAPTPATADNDTSIATTAFVKAQGYATSAAVPVPATATPLVESGTGTVGTSTKYAREDHVHPLGPGGGGGASITISDTAPTGQAAGALWWESDTGILYVNYNDGDSTQWVSVVSATDPSTYAVRYDQAQVLTENSGITLGQRGQARSNIAAAPIDALAYSGMQVNGSTEISQERGSTGFVLTTGGAVFYICDGWQVQVVAAATLAVNAYPQSANAPAGYQYSTVLQATTPLATPAAGDLVLINHPVEGYRTVRLAWGTTSAQSITIGFWIQATATGNIGLSVNNSAGDRNYVTDVAINTASTWEYKTVTIPGDTTGTWLKTNGIGFCIRFCAFAGSTRRVAANTWANPGVNGGYATSATSNFFTATNNAVLITGLVVLPGIEAPSAARAPLIMRPFDQELLTCQRYYQKTITGNGGFAMSGNCYTTTTALFYVSYPVMRAAPTISPTALADYKISTATVASGAITSFAPNAPGLSSSRVDTAVASGLTQNQPALLQAQTGTAAIIFDARL